MMLGLDKKIWSRYIILAAITIPLFGLLGGVPFPAFANNDVHVFLPFVYFICCIAFTSWVINIAISAAAGRYRLLRNIAMRATLSLVICIGFSVLAFSVFRSYNPPPLKFMVRNGNAVRGPVFFESPQKTAGLLPGDTVFTRLDNGLLKNSKRGFFPFPQFLHLLTINVMILFLCELVMLHYRQQKTERENARLRQSNLEARNSQLKNQLHPHFLFNSLNTLRLLLKKDQEKAETYLLRLSDILRVSTTSAASSVTEVKDELELCLSYLQMQEVRFGDALRYDVTNKKLLVAKGKLPVFALQVLAENAIKHNAFTGEYPLHIFIDYDEERQLITVWNKIRERRMAEVTTRTGLKNLNERYQLLCNRQIAVNNNGETFAVSIKII
ncbi:MAG: histidine kinase [Ferruginibacter sp.]